ncbi:MAG: tRNA preQ1(34) S-adenosylmethionine ribosyltransferase-isomerase QueA [Lentisphaerae bacterium]|nr:tRNA preQ1(34) S-adenosylmethionine ribosyltransferase-isomerase QueA [Lentisphaerota bacterium]
MRTSDFDYELPPGLIAQEPLPERSQSRMMVVCRRTGRIEHSQVTDLPSFLAPGDLLVVNNTRVIPARLFGERKDTGGQVELLLVEPVSTEETPDTRGPAEVWQALYRASGKPRPGLELILGGGLLSATVLGRVERGRVSVRLSGKRPVPELLEEAGLAPLPPYIKREREGSTQGEADRERYQTVYAEHAGAIAAPTAGLHFTTELLEELAGKGVRTAAVTLHVGPGTFEPVRSERVEDHDMDSERYRIGPAAADAVEETRKSGGRLVAVGSTTVRVLEAVMAEQGSIVPCSGRTSLFIRPPYEFKAVDAMLTNFHLPRSTLIMMVSALAGRDIVMRAYAEAVRRKYRFYSYGDCMLLTP